MISRMVQWIRRKVRPKPYDPTTDPVAQMLTGARLRLEREELDSKRSLQQNRIEAAMLHDRIEAQKRGANGGPME